MKEKHEISIYHQDGLLTPESIKRLIEQSLDADKATDIVCIDLAGNSAVADYMIVASGTSSRHVSSLARKVKEHLHTKGVQDVKIEGLDQSDWVVLDGGDVIVHLFRPEVREFYSIEKMWSSDTAFDVIGSSIQA